MIYLFIKKIVWTLCLMYSINIFISPIGKNLPINVITIIIVYIYNIFGILAIIFLKYYYWKEKKLNNIVYDYFKNASTKSAFPQAFLIGNVNFDAFKEQLESILENFFFNTKLDIYNNTDIFISEPFFDLNFNDELIAENKYGSIFKIYIKMK